MISKVAFSIISLVASGGQGFVFRLKTEADRKDSPRMNTMKRTSHNTEVQSTPILKLLIIKSRKCTCKDSNKSIIYPPPGRSVARCWLPNFKVLRYFRRKPGGACELVIVMSGVMTVGRHPVTSGF